jgi:lipoyl(octanoyl) transferase
MRIIDLHTLDYRSAWAQQEEIHAEVLAGAEEAILFVEHPPVITFGRRAEDSAKHLVASREGLDQLGVELVESDRGGDITFHGPGQLVAYPIVRLADHQLSVGAYVRRLQEAVIDCLAEFGINARTDEGAIGIWVDPPAAPVATVPAQRATAQPAKICALGVRIKRGVSLHGIALNVTTDLAWFNLIVPCGLAGRPVTSMHQHMGDKTPPMADVQRVLGQTISARIANQPIGQ